MPDSKRMSPRHHFALPSPLRTLLVFLLTAALPLLIATAPAGAAKRRGSHHRAHHACRLARPRHHHAHGCISRVHSHKSSHRHAATAAIIIDVLSTPCANTELTPAKDNLQAIATATLCLVNQERARHGEMPLRPNADLEAAADAHSQEMVSLNYFGHISPNGLTPLARVRDTGYIPSPQDGYTIGENIAWGTLELSTPKAIVAAWIASPEHLANILEVGYRDTAIGVDPEAPSSLSGGNAGAVYTQEFGVIVH